MTLQDIFDALKHGELAFLKVGELETPEEKEKVVSHINLALLDLHKRFPLRSKRIKLELEPEIYEYNLKNKFDKTRQQTSNSSYYLMDDKYSEYEEDVLKIERVLDKDELQLPLNDETTDNQIAIFNHFNPGVQRDGVVGSFYTPFFNVLRIPKDFTDEFVYVEYRAGHPRIHLKEESNPCNIDIDLSPIFLEPVLLYVANREFRSLNTDSKQESTDYMNLYELACKRISDMGYYIEPNRTNYKLDINGWS
jgi:hypothetical protein